MRAWRATQFGLHFDAENKNERIHQTESLGSPKYDIQLLMYDSNTTTEHLWANFLGPLSIHLEHGEHLITCFHNADLDPTIAYNFP